MGTAMWLWVRADWRRRWRSLLALALLLAVAVGVVITAFAGARRTSTSLDRLAAQARASDLLVDAGPYDPAFLGQIRAVHGVETALAGTIFFAVVDGVDEDLGLVAPRDMAGARAFDAGVLVSGRRPDPRRADEVVVNETAARILHRGAGDRVVIHTLSPEQVEAEAYFPPKGPDLAMTVTGVVREVEDAADRADGTIYATPALYDTVAGRIDEFSTYVPVALSDGVDPAAVERELYELAGDRPIDVFALSVVASAAQRTVDALTVGLLAFGAAAALAAVVVLGQAVIRHVAGAQADRPNLRALGASSTQCRLALSATALPVLVAGAAGALAVAAAGSTFMPIGLAGRMEIDPGLDLDVGVFAAAIGTAIALVAGAALLGAGHGSGVERRVPRPSLAVAAAGRAGGGPALVNGVGLAFDRSGPSLSRASLGAVVFAALAATGIVGFGSSLRSLVDDPSRWGYGWDITLDFTSGTVGDAEAAVADVAGVAAAARFDSGTTVVGGTSVRAHGLTRVKGRVDFDVRDGRPPARRGEVVLGPVTARRLGIGVGDVVDLAPEPGRRPTPLAVVGLALFPEIDEGDFTDGVGLLGEDFSRYATVTEAFNASQVVVRAAPDAELTSLTSRLGRTLELDLPTAGTFPRRPGDIETLATVEDIPRWLLAFVAALGLASLAHSLHAMVTRRRPHLAVLRALGMTRRQIGGCCLTSGATVLALAVVVGGPLGVIVGLRTWGALAHSVEVAPHPRFDVVPLGALALAGAALAAGMASRSARRVTASSLALASVDGRE